METEEKFGSKETKRILAILLTFALIFGLAVPGLWGSAYAATGQINQNVSSSAVSGNDSAKKLPSSAGTIKQGSSYYFNMQTKGSWKATEAKLYVKAPGSSQFTLAGTEKVNNYLRYAYIKYKFSKSGTYQYYWKVKAQSNKKTYTSSTQSVKVSAANNNYEKYEK